MAVVRNQFDLNGNQVINAAYTGLPLQPGGRLTLTGGTPVPAADATGGTLYYTPHAHNLIPLYDPVSDQVVVYPFAELSVPLGSMLANTNYDVVVWNNYSVTPAAPTPTLAFLSGTWTNATMRAGSGLARLNGMLCLAGYPHYRYVGTVRASANAAAADTAARRFVWNCYNRASRRLAAGTAASHTYSSATWRPWNGGTNLPRVEFVAGLAEDAVQAAVWGDLGTAMGATGYLGLVPNGAGSPPDNALTVALNGSGARLGAAGPILPGLGYNYHDLYELASGVSATFAAGAVGGTLLA